MENDQDGSLSASHPETTPGNRTPPREPVFNLAPVVTALGLACIAIHLARVVWFDSAQETWLIVRFAFLPIRYTGPYALDIYAFISPLSYSLLHGGTAHLVVNLVWLAAFGSPLANRIGSGRFLAFWAVSALAAAGLHFVIYPESSAPLVGASGAISGMMGAAARFAFRVDRGRKMPAFAGPVLPFSIVVRSRTVMAFLGVWMVVNLVTGLGFAATADAPQIAWEAHIGGFLVGFFGIRLFDRGSGRVPSGGGV